jgi:hypothetical protein
MTTTKQRKSSEDVSPDNSPILILYTATWLKFNTTGNENGSPDTADERTQLAKFVLTLLQETAVNDETVKSQPTHVKKANDDPTRKLPSAENLLENLHNKLTAIFRPNGPIFIGKPEMSAALHRLIADEIFANVNDAVKALGYDPSSTKGKIVSVVLHASPWEMSDACSAFFDIPNMSESAACAEEITLIRRIQIFFFRRYIVDVLYASGCDPAAIFANPEYSWFHNLAPEKFSLHNF